jgi:hypothetical protein
MYSTRSPARWSRCEPSRENLSASEDEFWGARSHARAPASAQARARTRRTHARTLALRVCAQVGGRRASGRVPSRSASRRVHDELGRPARDGPATQGPPVRLSAQSTDLPSTELQRGLASRSELARWRRLRMSNPIRDRRPKAVRRCKIGSARVKSMPPPPPIQMSATLATAGVAPRTEGHRRLSHVS